MPEQDFLVIYEEEVEANAADDDDRVILDIAARGGDLRGGVDVESDIGVESLEEPNHWGVIGLILTAGGFLFGIVSVIYFSIVYPDAWYGAGGVLDIGDQRGVLLLAVLASVLLIVGNLLTYYGRTSTARAVLHSFAIVEHVPRAHIVADEQPVIEAQVATSEVDER